MLDRLFSLLPRQTQRSLTTWAFGGEQTSSDLDDMRGFERPTSFTYTGGEMLHRDRGYASFGVEGAGRTARWGVSFDAIRRADPQWSNLFQSLSSLRDDAIAAGNRLFEQSAFEADGSLLIRDLKVEA